MLEDQTVEQHDSDEHADREEAGDSEIDSRVSRHKKRKAPTEAEVLLRFNSCGRCGLFLTTYRLRHEAEFVAALDEIEADWLTLPWHPDMRDLVNKSYGIRIDIESYFLEGLCLECLRPFSFAEPDPQQPAWFLIKL